MKAEIKYEYKQENDYPFTAFVYLEGKVFDCKSSKISFDDAKEQALERLKRNYSRQVPETIPENEEIEI